jgi:hypothetical protein
VFVTIVLLILLGISLHKSPTTRPGVESGVPDLTFIDFNDQFQKALLKDVMNIFYPGQYDRNATLVTGIIAERDRSFRAKLQSGHVEQHLTAGKFAELLGMYGKFIAVYIVVMLLTYYGVQTIAVWRFCRKKRLSTREASAPGLKILSLVKQGVIAFASFVLFSPAYVIAYSLRTELNTDTVIFMTVLCVISNGLLMVYANKFYAFLVAESRKGYVETAVVKNLRRSYARHQRDGIPLKAILRPFKSFGGHVFDHIFRNARHQYLSTIKEQATFLITGMIITEMALNIHGYLNYELLRQMLYRNYDIVIMIILFIFYTVKGTEILTDFLVAREERRYENS